MKHRAEAGRSKVLFANSGSEANDTAIKLVWYYHNAIGKPHKKKIIARLRGYHGVTVADGQPDRAAHNHVDFDLPIARILHTDCPSYYHHAEPGESEEAFVERLRRELEALIEREGPDTIGAFFAEPVMGAGGVIVPPDGYFEQGAGGAEAARHPARRRRGDRGFGRTGNMFGCETFGIRAGHDHLRQGALGLVSCRSRRLLVNETIYRGDGGRKPQDRHLRPRLHLRRPSGVRRGRASRP